MSNNSSQIDTIIKYIEYIKDKLTPEEIIDITQILMQASNRINNN